MSTITVTNIKATGQTASRAVSGVAGAWVNFNGTGTIAIRDDNNVSSLTDNNTGNYTVNLTSGFSNTNYNATALTGTGGALRNISVNTSVTITSSAFSVFTGPSNGTATGDCDFVYLTFHGDLA